MNTEELASMIDTIASCGHFTFRSAITTGQRKIDARSLRHTFVVSSPSQRWRRHSIAAMPSPFRTDDTNYLVFIFT